jgi:hypothetical protein
MYQPLLLLVVNYKLIVEYTPAYQKNNIQDRNKSVGKKNDTVKSSVTKNKSTLSKSFCPKFSLGNSVRVRVEKTVFDSGNNTIAISPTRNLESQDKFSRKAPTETIPEDSIELSGYANLLDNFKESYENFIASHITKIKQAFSKELNEVKESLGKEKLKNEKLEQENIRLTKEYENQCTLISSQKKLIKDLQLKIQTENNKQKESLEQELTKLTQDNNKLQVQVKQLTEQLNQSKEQEAALERLIKSNSFVTSCTESLTTNETAKTNKPKKPNVIIPKLDFTKLPQKEQAKIKVIQCEINSLSSAGDITEEAHNFPEATTNTLKSNAKTNLI